MSGCSDLAEVLLFRVPDGRWSVCESSANSKEQINALNSLPVTAPFKKGQNSNRRAPWQRTLPGLRLPSERQEKESFPSCMHAKKTDARWETLRCTAALFFFLPLPSLPAVSRDSWTEMKARPLQSSLSTLSLSLANLHSCLSDICTGPPLCLLSGERPNISSPTPKKKRKKKSLRCIDRAAGKRTLWPRYERVCGLVIKGKQGPPRGLAEFRKASQWAARKRIGFRGGRTLTAASDLLCAAKSSRRCK